MDDVEKVLVNNGIDDSQTNTDPPGCVHCDKIGFSVHEIQRNRKKNSCAKRRSQ